MYLYPYGNSQQLNLDWIIAKIKELEQTVAGNSIEEVSNALISATYNPNTQYRRYDYCYLDGKLYRCLTDTTGVFNPADWMEVVIGDDIPILTRLLNAVDASVTTLQNAIKAYLFLGSGADAPVIENGTDYNNITTVGAYRVLTKADAATMINTPNTKVTNRLIVMCLVNSASIVQVFICNYDTNPAIFARVKSTDAIWSPWRLLSPIRNTVITVAAGTGTQTFTWNICSPDVLVSNVHYSNPQAIGSDVTFTTGDGTISINGTFYESTDIQFDVQ